MIWELLEHEIWVWQNFLHCLRVEQFNDWSIRLSFLSKPFLYQPSDKYSLIVQFIWLTLAFCSQLASTNYSFPLKLYQFQQLLFFVLVTIHKFLSFVSFIHFRALIVKPLQNYRWGWRKKIETYLTFTTLILKVDSSYFLLLQWVCLALLIHSSQT